MLYPERDEVIVYRCGHCRHYFLAQTGDTRVRCAAHHRAPACCHYGEKDLGENWAP